jgi:hypothetical protein
MLGEESVSFSLEEIVFFGFATVFCILCAAFVRFVYKIEHSGSPEEYFRAFPDRPYFPHPNGQCTKNLDLFVRKNGQRLLKMLEKARKNARTRNRSAQ